MKANSPHKPRRHWLLPSLIAIVIFAGEVSIEILGDDLRTRLAPYKKWVWITFGLALITAIILAIRDAREPDEPIQTNPENNQRNISIGGNVDNSPIISGDYNNVVSGNKTDKGDIIAGDKYEYTTVIQSVSSPKVELENVVPASQFANISSERLNDLWREYKLKLTEKVGSVYLLGESQSQKRDLKQVFVHLNINEEYERPSEHNEWRGFAGTELRQRQRIFDVRNDGAETHSGKRKKTIKPDDLLREGTRAVVTGQPGCGKSTLLNWLSGKCLEVDSKWLPVFLELKTINERKFEKCNGDIVTLLFDQSIAPTLPFENEIERDELNADFRKLLAANGAAVFLDGLDEVRDKIFFNDLCNAINQFVRSTCERNLLIISSRPYAIDVHHFRPVKEMEIAPLTHPQVADFLHHYYDDDKSLNIPALIQKLKQRDLGSVVRVPILLGAIVRHYRKTGDLIEDRLELYDKLVHDLAYTLDAEKHLERFKIEDPKGHRRLDFLKQIAFERLLMQDTSDDVSRVTFSGGWLLEQAKSFCQSSRHDPYDFVEDVKKTALIREIGYDEWAFSHLTIQEYLAAVVLAKRPDCERVFCRAYFNPTLAELEVLPMTLGLVSEPDTYYEQLENLPESLSLAGLRLRARGLGYASISPKILNSLIEKLDDFILLDDYELCGYHDPLLKAFSTARGQVMGMILNHIFQLGSDSEDYKKEAVVESLAIFQNEDSAKLIRKFLTDVSAEVRIKAASAILWCDAESAFKVLTKESRNSDEEIKRKVLRTVREIFDEKSTEILIEAISDEEKTIKVEAIEALGYGGYEKATSLLIGLLCSEDEWVSEQAAAALVNIGGEEVLSGLLNGIETNFKARKHIVNALGRMNDVRAISPLLRIFEIENYSVRKEIIKALGKIKSEEQIEFLKSWLTTAKKEWLHSRTQNYRSLKERGNLLNSEGLLINLAWSLQNLGEKIGTATLLELLEKEGVYNKSDVVLALAENGGDTIETALLKAWEDAKSLYVKEQSRIPSKSKDGIPIIFVSPTPSLLVALAETLTELGHCELVSTIYNWLDDERFNTGDFINALGRCKGQLAVEGLLKISRRSSSSDFSKYSAISILGNIRDKYAVAGLLEGLKFYQDWIQVRSIDRIVSLDRKTILDGLTIALHTEDRFVQRKAIEHIAYYSDSESLEQEFSVIAKSELFDKARISLIASQLKYKRKLLLFE